MHLFLSRLRFLPLFKVAFAFSHNSTAVRSACRESRVIYQHWGNYRLLLLANEQGRRSKIGLNTQMNHQAKHLITLSSSGFLFHLSLSLSLSLCCCCSLSSFHFFPSSLMSIFSLGLFRFTQGAAPWPFAAFAIIGCYAGFMIFQLTVNSLSTLASTAERTRTFIRAIRIFVQSKLCNISLDAGCIDFVIF